MTGKSHAMIGGAAGLGVGIAGGYGWQWVAMAALVGMIAALLPDLDSTDSIARTKLGLGKEQISREWARRPRPSLLMRWVISWPLNIIAKILPHRGPTHWLVTAVLFTVGMYTAVGFFGWPPVLWQAFGVGYLSHILADGLTISGVPMLGPVTRRSFRFLPKPLALRTGGAAEFLVVGGGLAVLGVLSVWQGWL